MKTMSIALVTKRMICGNTRGSRYGAIKRFKTILKKAYKSIKITCLIFTTENTKSRLIVWGKTCPHTESRKHTITLLVIELVCVKTSPAGSKGAYAMTVKTISRIYMPYRLISLVLTAIPLNLEINC